MKNHEFLFAGILSLVFLLSQNVLFGQVSCTTNSGANFIATPASGAVNMSGGSFIKLIAIDPTWANSPITLCDDSQNSPCTASSYNLASGDYQIQIFDSSWNDCTTATITITSCSPDNDGDGFCGANDCDDNDASVPATPGTSCNDGDPNTSNDIIQTDGCTCAGTPSGGCTTDNDNDGSCAGTDCDDNDPNVTTFTPGTACNDGDTNTTNDVYQSDGCTCAGTPSGGGTSVWAQNGSNINYDTGLGNIGKVGIGEANPAYTLSVNGNVGAKEYKATLNGWSDYVFAKDYQLMPLGELEKYIGSNQHLLGIPSEKEVLANGIFLGEMNALLLAKVEELTLHVIQLNKEVEKLKTGKE